MTYALKNMPHVSIGKDRLEGYLDVPDDAKGLIIFAHGSGSGRNSPRNNYVAAGLRQAGFATLLIDLLEPAEETDRAKVFDIGLLASRLVEVTDWAHAARALAHLPVGYFGASTGAGASIRAAVMTDAGIGAIVSRGGRPDLAGDALDKVQAPTLLIVGSLDTQVIALNREALARIPAEKALVIVPGAGHLFEEHGALDQVLGHAAHWFAAHLVDTSGGGRHAIASS